MAIVNAEGRGKASLMQVGIMAKVSFTFTLNLMEAGMALSLMHENSQGFELEKPIFFHDWVGML